MATKIKRAFLQCLLLCILFTACTNRKITTTTVKEPGTTTVKEPVNTNKKEPAKSKYGVKAVSTIEEYKTVVASDPSKALVNLKEFIPGLKLDIRYATADNFMKQVMYPSASAYLSLPAAKALAAVQQELKAMGYGLKIYDAYRPYSITVAFYEKVKDTVFVASAYRGSRHNRGCAVDLSIINLAKGVELAMPTPYDDFTEKAHSDYSNLTAEQIKNRELLKKLMTKYGFDIYAAEWWHYDYKGWKEHPIMDISFKQLAKGK